MIPGVAGISGGRTSAYMATLLSSDVVLSFQNTGREHAATYRFLERLEQHLGRPIVWLEWRSPAPGCAPVEASFEVVTAKTANRTGKPFEDMLRCLAAYRRILKGLGPIAPWSMQRLCTSYLKIRTQRKYVEALGWDAYDEFVGLRADEPKRIVQARARETQRRGGQLPLADAGIVKQDVIRYWAGQPFDLDLEEPFGNCDGCFLKDEADLSRIMAHPDTDFAWWERMQREYQGFGGNDKTPYSTLRAEAPLRLEIERRRRGSEPVLVQLPSGMTRRRFKLIVRQEVKRIANGATPFSCNCEVGGDVEEAS